MKLLKFLLALCSLTFLFSAEAFDPSFINGRYLFTDFGFGTGSYRDRGTSPLTYTGPSFALATGYLAEQSKYSWEFKLNTHYTAGLIDQGYLLNHFAEEIQLSYLRLIPLIDRSDMNLKAGGRLSSSFSGSFNSAYENASLNIDIFSSLLVRAQYTYAFIIPEKQKKKRVKPETHHALICNLELPLIQFNARPDFPYVMDGNNIIYNRHVFLGGFSMQSSIAFRSFLPNGNGFDISYIWNMYQTGKKDLYQMEKASHHLQLSYYFKLD